MFVYFDNNATTKVEDEVVEIIINCLKKDYANPNSIHQFGVDSNKIMMKSRKKISELLKVQPMEVFFTSCATESINWAIRGVAKGNKKFGKHIISSKIEHHAELNTLKILENEGYEVTYIDVDKNGVYNLDTLSKSLRKDTILVSLMAANNETGTIEPIKKISKIIKERSPEAFFHVDCVQIPGKIDFSIADFGCDMASFSAHKFHGPKGVGIFFKKEKVRIFPLITGGNQERGMRSGTQNVPGIAGTAKALEKAFLNLDDMKRIKEIRNYIAKEIKKLGGTIVTPLENSVPNTLAVFFEGKRGEVITNSLSMENICVSTTSACSSKGPKGSQVLSEMGYNNNQSLGMIRISLSHLNNREEAEYFVNKLKKVLVFLKF